MITLGTYAEGLMRDPLFNVLYEIFREQVFYNMMGSEAHETKKREGCYAEMQGLQKFLAMTKSFVDRKDELIAEAQTSQEEQDTE